MAILFISGLIGIAVLWRWRRGGGSFFDFLQVNVMCLFARLWHRCSPGGQVSLPAGGPAILVANHSSHADPAFLVAAGRRALHFLQAKECYDVFLLRRLFRRVGCIPVARDGRDVAGVRQALRQLREGAAVCVFPEGEICPRGRDKLGPGKRGAALLALRSQVPVIPARITGGPRTRNMLRAWLCPSRGVRVTFGPAVDLSPYYGRHIDHQLMGEVTALLMRAIASI